MNKETIQTKRFVLKPLNVDDVTDRYVGWLNDEKTSEFITFSKQHWNTLDTVRDYVKKIAANPNILFFGIFERSENQHIGNIKFELLEPEKKTAEMGIMIGESCWRGKGVAREVLDGSADYLSNHLQISKIQLGVSKDNLPAVKAYQKAHFSIKKETKKGGYIMVRTLNNSLNELKKIAIGTVQFGLKYGVSNQQGQVTFEESKTILSNAKKAGINVIDTAVVYGESEEILGKINVTENWEIVSKIPPIKIKRSDVSQWVRSETAKSFDRLGVDKIFALMVHKPSDLLLPEGNEIFDTLKVLKEEGLVQKVGYSVHSPKDLDLLWDQFTPDIVQIPFNVLDRRMQTSGWLQKMHDNGVEIHARSAFLQGLLLMDKDKRPEKFNEWSSIWDEWHSWLERDNISAVDACLSFALSIPEIDRVVLGVHSSSQLDEIIKASSKHELHPPQSLVSNDENLINPANWSS